MKAEVLIASHTASPHVPVPCYCWSALWGYVSKRNCLGKHFCCGGYCYALKIYVLFGCDHRTLQVLSMTLALNVALFIYHKQLVINITASTSSHLFFCHGNSRNSECGVCLRAWCLPLMCSPPCYLLPSLQSPACFTPTPHCWEQSCGSWESGWMSKSLFDFFKDYFIYLKCRQA